MDVLKGRWLTTRRLAWAAGLLLWAVVAACLSRPGGRAEPSFPHRVHVVDNQLACAFCHGSARADEDPGMPPPELCAPCHDRFDARKPPERRVGAFFGPGGRYRKVAEAALPGDVTFSHRRHVTDANLDCRDCHGDVGAQDEVPLGPLVRKADCMGCHAERGAPNQCSTCHRQIDPSWLPPSHTQDWIPGHGAVVRFGSERSADRCELCHQDAQQGCKGCHQQMAPQDHNQSFRLRTHGLQASLDRSRCATCHTQDSCEQCHQETRPLSHRGNFGQPGNRHCVSCHLPLADSGCQVCHRSTPSHDLAAPLPPGHSPAMNCRLCHGNGVPLPHPDGGQPCTACHR